jgi:hypothetical protein
VLLGTPLHAASNFNVSVQLANKRELKKKFLEALRAVKEFPLRISLHSHHTKND